MRCYLYVVILISYSLFNHVFGSDEGLENNTVFIPTTEWQTVKKGTPIPKGLHVRHNFQTGITEAKLLDPDDEGTNIKNNEMSNSLALHPDVKEKLSNNHEIKFQPDDKSGQISTGELKAKLKEIKLSKAPFASKAEHADIRDKKTRFQSYNDMKKDFENLNFGKSSDVDLLAAFINQFNIHKNAITSGSLTAEEVKGIIDILSQLEYLVHDIDNGLEFTRSGGLSQVIYPCLNGTIEEIKIEALHVLGAAVQSNPKVKQAALELEFVPSILRTLIKYGNPKLMDRCIYALGSLVRLYPTAQKVFLSHGGLEIFTQVLVEGPVSTQKRIINLINDLIVERQELDEINDLENRNLKREEYADVKFEEKIIQHRFCTNLGSLLVKTIQNEIKTEFNTADHDLLEAIYECTLTAGNICKLEFKKNEDQILPALNEISRFYNSLDMGLYTDENNPFSNLLILVEKIRETMFVKLRDEL